MSPPIALVTGAARRIGRAIALHLARNGWDIAVHFGGSEREAEKTVADIRTIGQRAVALQADLRDEGETRSLVDRCADALGVPKHIVNSASLFDYDNAASFSYAQLAAHTSVNLAAPVMLARELHRRLEEEGEQGVVINLLDQKLWNPNPDYLSYSLSKAGLEAATILLAQALAPRVRVCAIAPGLTLGSAFIDEARLKQLQSALLLERGPEVEDIAAAVRFLLESTAITGTTLLVDGGQHLQPSGRDVAFVAHNTPSDFRDES